MAAERRHTPIGSVPSARVTVVVMVGPVTLSLLRGVISLQPLPSSYLEPEIAIQRWCRGCDCGRAM